MSYLALKCFFKFGPVVPKISVQANKQTLQRYIFSIDYLTGGKMILILTKTF